MAVMNPLVRVEGLHKSFGSLNVLKGIDLTVQQGQKISLIGPSGSGKTTLLRCINYLEEPTQGSIYLDNELIGQRLVGNRKVPMGDKDLARMRAEMGMVFQRFNLFPHLTVLENIILGPMKVQKRERRDAVAHAEELLKKVGMLAKRDGRIEMHVDSMGSGYQRTSFCMTGMKQRGFETWLNLSTLLVVKSGDSTACESCCCLRLQPQPRG